MKTLFCTAIVFSLLFFAAQIQAAQLGSSLKFTIESPYDISGREELTASLVKITPRLYFYVDLVWWNANNSFRRSELINKLNIAAFQFEDKIYPDLTSVFGSEWKPGVDGDEHITILIHQMRGGANGYFRTADEYLKLQVPDSNEKEMLYLSLTGIEGPFASNLLAHEFVHLITFNQKDRIFGVAEETWLNEARAEYASTLLGYDIPYQGSYLERRVQEFFKAPSDSLTEWQGKEADYGSINLFVQYLVDHYGVGVLIDSLHTAQVGIPSLNQALLKNGFEKTFNEIFTEWTIAMVLNDCTLGKEYCYLSTKLQDLRVNPVANFLPLVGESTLSITQVTKNWSGNWLKFLGGQGTLKLEFSSLKGLSFATPYLIQKADGSYVIELLSLNENQQGEVLIENFGTENRVVIFIPSLQTKTLGFNGGELTFPFSLTASIVNNTSLQTGEVIAALLEQISFLRAEVARLVTQLALLSGNVSLCGSFTVNLSFGMSDNAQVRCLQEFLKNQGSAIYPEGLVTGNFGPLTRAAVVRFQERYATEILSPLGLSGGTGFFGPSSRAKVNGLLNP